MFKAFEILKRGALYAVIISFAIYMLLGFSDIASAGMPWHRFLAIVLYGILISFSEWVSEVLPSKGAVKVAVNFVIDLVGFVAVYLVVTDFKNFNAGRFFILLGVFAVCYALVILIVKLFNQLLNLFTIDKSPAPTIQKKQEPAYRPRYTDEE